MNSIYESLYYNKRNGRCEATVVTASGFQRQPITPADYDTLAARLRRFITSTGPTCIYFDIRKQQEVAQ